MQVRMLRIWASPTGNFNLGDTADIADALGAQLVANGDAEAATTTPVDAPAPAPAAPVEAPAPAPVAPVEAPAPTPAAPVAAPASS